MRPATEPERSLGLAWMVLSGLTLGGSVLFGLTWIGIATLAGTLPDTNTGEPLPPWAAFLVGGFGAAIALLLILISGAGLLAGWGLRRGSSWAPPLAMVLALMSLFNFPIGTLLGGLTLLTLLRRQE